MSRVLGTETYGTYLDVEEQVMPWMQFSGITVSDATDFALSLVVDAVCTEVQRFIGHAVAPTVYGPGTGIGKFDGSGGLYSGYIVLPRAPVISITKVVEYQGDHPVTLVEVDPQTGTPPTSTGYQVTYRTGTLTRVLGRVWNRPFFPGSNNVWVTWTAGYNPIPADLVWATLDWVTHVYRNTQQARRSGSVRGQGEAEPSTVTQGLWAAIPDRVKTVLESYMRVGIR